MENPCTVVPIDNFIRILLSMLLFLTLAFPPHVYAHLGKASSHNHVLLNLLNPVVKCILYSFLNPSFSTHIYAGSMLILAKQHLMIMHAIPFTFSLPHDFKKTKRRSISKVDRTC
jgi:hypothetical protein